MKNRNSDIHCIRIATPIIALTYFGKSGEVYKSMVSHVPSEWMLYLHSQHLAPVCGAAFYVILFGSGADHVREARNPLCCRGFGLRTLKKWCRSYL